MPDYNLAAAVIAGFILDLLVGDPRGFRFHPVRIIGRHIAKSETLFRRLSKNQSINGLLFMIFTALFWTAVFWAGIRLSSMINRFWGTLTAALFFYFTICIKDLQDHVTAVKRALDGKDIISARNALAKIVGRDTENLDNNGIIRATVETAAESTVDGIIAPIFFACAGGIHFAWFYKIVNTLDSMVGYRNEKYISFGRASARTDFLLNIIPSLLSVFLSWIAAFILRKDCINTLKVSFQDALKKRYFSTLAIEAAFAGALRIKLGGVSFYQGKPRMCPELGKNFTAPESRHIADSLNLSYIISLITAGIAVMYLIFTGNVDILTAIHA